MLLVCRVILILSKQTWTRLECVPDTYSCEALFLLDTVWHHCLSTIFFEWAHVIESASIHIICANKIPGWRQRRRVCFGQRGVIEWKCGLILVSQPICWNVSHRETGWLFVTDWKEKHWVGYACGLWRCCWSLVDTQTGGKGRGSNPLEE